MKLIKCTITCLFFVIFFGCESDQKKQFEIKEKIKMLNEKQESFYQIKFDTCLFSEDLIEQMKSIRLITEKDAKRIKNSDSPTDKPNQMEGSTFTSLADGYSKYTIKKIKVSGNKATVFVVFEYDSTPKEIWEDMVLLEYSNTWKVTNIKFSNKYSSDLTTLKDKFNYFISINDTIEHSVKDKNGNLMKMVFMNSNKTVSLHFNNETITLQCQRPASGMWYANGEYELRGKGDQVSLSKSGKVVFTTFEEISVPFKEAQNYFLLTNYKEAPLHSVKITNQKFFDSLFGAATTMGKNGRPTPIDFNSNYIIAIIDKKSNRAKELSVKSITQLKNELTIVMFSSEISKSTYVSRPVKLLIVPKTYQGALKLEEY